MLGFSFNKLALLLLLGGVVWIGFRYMSRLETMRRALREELRRRQAPKQPMSVKAEDLIQCAPCAAYVAARGARSCGRADCPWER
jgi:hypothetical protein